jgi:hypothetical protein
MTGAKWWLRIVGSLYLVEGIGLTLQALFAPESFAALWASVPAETLDEIAIRGMLLAGMPGVLTWVLLGALQWIFSAAPAKGALLMLVVSTWELLVWMPVDLLALFHGFAAERSAILSSIHLAIGVSGLLLYRRARRGSVPA